MVGTLLSFSLMAILGARARPRSTSFEILSIRAGGGLIVLLAMVGAAAAAFALSRAAPDAACISRATARISSRNIAGRWRSRCCRSRPCSRSNSRCRSGRRCSRCCSSRALHAEPRRHVVLGLPRRAGDPAARHRGFQPAALRVLLAAFGYAISIIATKKLTAPSQHVRDPVLDERDAVADGAAWPAYRATSPSLFLFRLGADRFCGARRSASAADLALLPDQCASRRRRHRGDPARLPAHPADRVRRLDVLRRTARPLRVRGRGPIICGVLWNLQAESRRSRSPPAASTEKAQTAEF